MSSSAGDPSLALHTAIRQSVEAVYYSHAVPRNPEVLTTLGLIFDRLYFPGVYMPPPGFDQKAVESEIQRISSHFQGRLDPNTRQMLDCMSFALHYKDVAELCIFPGKPGRIEQFDGVVHDVVNQLELMVFGPRPEGEIPIHHGGPWVKGLAGDDPTVHQLRAPDTIYYPANALVFAARRNLPLVNDLEWLPVPGIPVDPKANAKLLATILTMESVSLVLPRLKPLQPAALRTPNKTLHRGSLMRYSSFAYSALACFRMGMSGSASFQRVRKS